MDEQLKLQAAKYYDSVDFSNFTKEYERSLLIKKSVKKYYKSGYINLRLVLNHVIILHNFFGVFATTILFRIIPKDHYPLLNTILIFLDRLPKHMYNNSMQVDTKIQRELNNL